MVRDRNRRLNNGKHYRQNRHQSAVKHSKIHSTVYRQADLRQNNTQRSLSTGQRDYMQKVRMRSSTPDYSRTVQRHRQ